MPAHNTLYQELYQTLSTAAQGRAPSSSVARLTAIVLGIIAAKSCLIAQVAQELNSLALTLALPESIERRLRRTLNDPYLRPDIFYQPLVSQFLDWSHVMRGSRQVVVAVDESTKEDEIHLFRVSLTYQGRAVPLAWAIWEQSTKLATGAYWRNVDQVLAIVATLLPFGIKVTVVADRFYDNPPFTDRLAAYGWHWIIRVKSKGSIRFLDRQGREQALRDLIDRHVRVAGRRWKTRGKVFKDAGWREVSVVAMWGQGHKELLAVLTDLEPRWEVLAIFERRSWIEPAFRDDKSRGWHWEDSQVKGLDHQGKLLLGMAIASLITLCLGLQEAKERLERLVAQPIPKGTKVGKPRRVKVSLFTLGLARAKKWLYGNIQYFGQWLLTELEAPSWQQIWYAHQSLRYIFHCPVRP